MDETGKIGIVIEDGQIVADNTESKIESKIESEIESSEKEAEQEA